MPYAEDKDRPTKTVYSFVPKKVVEAVIAKHDLLGEILNKTE